MWPFKLVRKIFKILKSDLTPNQIGVGFCLGIFMGIAPLGLHSGLLISLALLFRCSFSSFLLAFALFKLLSILSAPLSYTVGRTILEQWTFLHPLWQALFHWPVIAPMGYNRYLLFGSYAIAFLISIPVFFIIRVLIIKYRTSFVGLVESWPLYQRWKKRRLFKLLRWLVGGGEAKFKRARKRPHLFRYIRKEMLIGLPLLCLIAYLLAGIIVPFLATGIVTRASSAVVGSEVSVEDTSFNLFTGRLTLQNLTVQNPERTGENVMQIPEMAIDVGMLPLLEARLVFNEGLAKEINFNVKREEDGSLNIDDFEAGWDFEGYIAWLQENAPRVDWIKLFQKYIEYRSRRKPRLTKREELAQFKGRKPFPDLRPLFTWQRLGVERVHLTLRDEYKGKGDLPRITAIEVTLENLAIASDLNKQPVLLSLKGELEGDPESFFRLTARFDYRGEPVMHEYSLELRNIDLVSFLYVYEQTLPVRLTNGKATLASRITVRGEVQPTELYAENNLLLEKLHIEQKEDRPLFGLDQETCNRVVEGINNYAEEYPIVIGFLIDGTTASPTFHWERQFLEIAKQGLIMEGKREVQKYIDQLDLKIIELETLETGKEIQLQPEFKVIQDAVEELIQQSLGIEPKDLEKIQELIEQLFGKGEAEESTDH